MSYAQDGPLKNKLDYGKLLKKKRANLYTQASIKKYASIPKEALIRKAILADYIIQALKYVLNLLRPFSWIFVTNRKLKQVFDMLTDIVRMRE